MVKKNKKKKECKISKKNLVMVAGILGILLIIGGILFATISSEELNKRQKDILDVFNSKISPLELSQNKGKYQGKTIIIKGAYIPSEAFIYIQEENDKIFLNPTNKDYCRNYDLTGILQYNTALSRWEFFPENYDNCLDN